MAANALSAISVIGVECKGFSSYIPTSTSLAPNGTTKIRWLVTMPTTKLSPNSSNFGPLLIQRPSVNLTISIPEGAAATEKTYKWSLKSMKSFAMGELEASKMKADTGTEALLMGILIEGTNFASRFLRANGITLFRVRDESRKLRGKPPLSTYIPQHPPLTVAARRAFDWCVNEKLKSGEQGSAEITTTHILLGVWHQEDSRGRQILSTLGFNEEKAQELRSLISDPTLDDDL